MFFVFVSLLIWNCLVHYALHNKDQSSSFMNEVCFPAFVLFLVCACPFIYALFFCLSNVGVDLYNFCQGFKKRKICIAKQTYKFIIRLTFEHINLNDPNELNCYGFAMASTFFIVMLVLIYIPLYVNMFTTLQLMNIIVIVSKTRLLEARESQCHHIGFLCQNQSSNHTFKDNPSSTCTIGMCIVLPYYCTCKT